MVKDNFETLSKNRIEFTTKLALDDELAKCMINKDDNFVDSVITEEDKYNLMYSQIYPFKKTTETLTETKSYITLSFKYKKSQSSNVFKAAYVTFYLFCHEEIIRTPYMTLRYDYMLQCVDRLINDSRSDNWMGKMQLESMDDMIIDSDGKYVGVAVTYKNTEFQ